MAAVCVYADSMQQCFLCVLQTSSMTSGDLGQLNETAQAVRVMKEKYMLWQQRLDTLISQVYLRTHLYSQWLSAYRFDAARPDYKLCQGCDIAQTSNAVVTATHPQFCIAFFPSRGPYDMFCSTS